MRGALRKGLTWLAAVCCLGVLTALGIREAVFGLGLLLSAALGAVLLNLYLSRRWSVRLSVPVIGEKNRPLTLSAAAVQDSRLPGGSLCCTLLITNDLTGERQSLPLTLLTGGERQITLCLSHCGRHTISLERAYAMSLLGFLPRRLHLQSRCRVTVLPDTFETEVQLTVPQAWEPDSDAYAPDQRGTDPTETYQVRDYVPGDSLRQMHWKLSGKLDRPVIREPSLPVSRSVQVFWDKAGAAEPAVMDAQAEVLSSLCQALCLQGHSFTLGWTGQAEAAFVESQEALLQTLPMALGQTPAIWEEPAFRSWGRRILLTSRESPLLEQLPQNTTVLFCGVGPGICYTPENYAATLRILELT